MTAGDDDLRELQRKAYGRGGGLTDAEAERLRALEVARAADARVEDAGAEDAGADESIPPVPVVAAPLGQPDRISRAMGGLDSPDADADARAAASQPVAPLQEHAAMADGQVAVPTWRRFLAARWKAAAAASALLIAVGLGAGWALFAPHDESIPLSDDEVQRRIQLSEKGGYDEGSVRAVARDDDALVWYATKSDPDLLCLILDVGEDSSASCVAEEDVATFPLSASVFVRDDEGADGYVGGTSVNAFAMPATDGRPLVAVQRWNATESMLSQYVGEEHDRAVELMSDGFSPDISLIGYFRGQPVWFGSIAGESCVVLDATGDRGCRKGDELFESIEFGAVDPNGAASWRVSVRFTRWQMPYLTITEGEGVATTVVTDTESGDPIEVTGPITDPDG